MGGNVEPLQASSCRCLFSHRSPMNCHPERNLSRTLREVESKDLRLPLHSHLPVLLNQQPAPLSSTPKPINLPPIPLRWSASLHPFELHHRLTLLRHLQPQHFTSLRLTIKRLRNRRRPTHLTQQQNLHLEVAAIVLHLQKIPDPNLPRCLGQLLIRLNPAEFTSPCSQRPRLEKSRRPKPLIHPHRGHDPFSYKDSPQQTSKIVHADRSPSVWLVVVVNPEAIGTSRNKHGRCGSWRSEFSNDGVDGAAVIAQYEHQFNDPFGARGDRHIQVDLRAARAVRIHLVATGLACLKMKPCRGIAIG